MPRAVRRVACEVELALAGIDEAHACCAFQETLQRPLGFGVLGGVLPGVARVCPKAAQAEELVAKLACAKPHVVSP